MTQGNRVAALYKVDDSYDVVVLADASAGSLEPLVDDQCQAMLPVVGKPIVEHVMESIVPLRPKHVLVVGCPGVDQLGTFIGGGERWGLDARTVVSRSDCTPERALHKYDHILGNAVIVIDCLSIRDFSIVDVLGELKGRSVASVYDKNGDSAGMTIFRRDHDGAWPGKTPARVEVASITCFEVSSIKAYFESSLSLISGSSREHLRFRGRDVALGLTCGPGTRISASSVKLGRVYSGSCTVAHPSTEFSGTVVLGNNVVIDKRCLVRDALVLDNTYVGSQLTIERSIVKGNRLISVDSETAVDLDDPHLLASIAPYDFPDMLNSLLQRSLGALVLLLSLPLWLVAFLVALLMNPNKPVIVNRWVGQGASDGPRTYVEFSSLSFNCNSGLLSYLPLLAAVTTGRIRWFGVSLLTPAEFHSRSEGWETARDQYPIGLFGPSQLASVRDMSLADRLLADAMYGEWSYRDFVKSVWKRAGRPMAISA